jgi:2-polyprenyl-3-methyl-5-hydroxy-6-metoxy-1,4-benzoquinol methylase
MDKRFEDDIRAFNCISPVLTYRCWEILVSCRVIASLHTFATIDTIINATGIRNKKMLLCMLNFLSGKGFLQKRGHSFKALSPPIFSPKEDLLFLYDKYYQSMIWVDSVSLCSPAVLLSNNPLDLMGFGSKSDLTLWEAIMSESPYSFRKFLIDKLLSNSKDGYSILDFGCGGGVGIVQMIEQTKHPISITGVDSSQSYLEKAKEKLSSKKISEMIHKKKISVDLRLHNFLNDFQALGKYDAIFMSLVLNHLTESEISLLFQKLRSYLKDGGVLGIYQIVNKSELERSPLCWVMHVIPSHKCYPDKTRYLSLLKENFEKIEEHFLGSVILASNSTP